MPGVSSSSFHSSFDAIVRKQQRNMRKYECIKGKIECTDKWITVFHVVHLRIVTRALENIVAFQKLPSLHPTIPNEMKLVTSF